MSRRRMRNSSLMEIGAVVFDLGGVLVDVDYRYLYRQLLPSEEASSVPCHDCTRSGRSIMIAEGQWQRASPNSSWPTLSMPS